MPGVFCYFSRGVSDFIACYTCILWGKRFKDANHQWIAISIHWITFFFIVFLYSVRSPEIEWDNYISNDGPQFLLSTKLYMIIERICNWLMELYAFQLGNGDQVQGFCRSSAYQCKYQIRPRNLHWSRIPVGSPPTENGRRNSYFMSWNFLSADELPF